MKWNNYIMLNGNQNQVEITSNLDILQPTKTVDAFKENIHRLTVLLQNQSMSPSLPV